MSIKHELEIGAIEMRSSMHAKSESEMKPKAEQWLGSDTELEKIGGYKGILGSRLYRVKLTAKSRRG